MWPNTSPPISAVFSRGRHPGPPPKSPSFASWKIFAKNQDNITFFEGNRRGHFNVASSVGDFFLIVQYSLSPNLSAIINRQAYITSS